MRRRAGVPSCRPGGGGCWRPAAPAAGLLPFSGPAHSEAEKEPAWQFTQFLAQPDTQAFWHTQTGYFPVTTAALDEPEDNAFLAENPLFRVAIDSLDATQVRPATPGCAAGAMPQIRKATEDGLERALIGKDPVASLQQVQENVAGSIANDNDSVG